MYWKEKAHVGKAWSLSSLFIIYFGMQLKLLNLPHWRLGCFWENQDETSLLEAYYLSVKSFTVNMISFVLFYFLIWVLFSAGTQIVLSHIRQPSPGQDRADERKVIYGSTEQACVGISAKACSQPVQLQKILGIFFLEILMT